MKKPKNLLCRLSFLFALMLLPLWVNAQNVVKGTIVDAPRGNNGFGYDPIFYVPEFGKTTAELTEEEKNKVSHRGKALELMKEELKKYEDFSC